MIDTSPISRISPFLFPMFSGQDRASPWTRPPTPKPCKLNDTTVAPKKRGRTPVSANCASQSKVNSEKVNNTQVPSGGDLGDNRVAPPNAQSNKKFKITDAFLSNGKYFIKVPGNEKVRQIVINIFVTILLILFNNMQLIPFTFDARFGIPKHVKIHEMDAAG
jgi:hypothetical protein